MDGSKKVDDKGQSWLLNRCFLLKPHKVGLTLNPDEMCTQTNLKCMASSENFLYRQFGSCIPIIFFQVNRAKKRTNHEPNGNAEHSLCGQRFEGRGLQ